uniref:Uncharacterized protein n=1 Tax=Antonospora locustae TaxID=278021 RepID=Q6E6C9_ANTLO|nr:hypothetical protein [Antonospora locustae]
MLCLEALEVCSDDVRESTEVDKAADSERRCTAEHEGRKKVFLKENGGVSVCRSDDKAANKRTDVSPSHARAQAGSCTRENVLMRPIYICAAGLQYLYLLRMEHIEFRLLSKINMRASFLQFDGRVHFVSQKRLFSLEGSPVENFEEECVVKPYSVEPCHSFYIRNNKIHLVHDHAPLFSLYINNIRTTVKDLKGVLYTPHNDSLIFYKSGLISVGGRKFEIKKINCLRVRKNRVIVGTGDGYVYIIRDKRLQKRVRLDDFPITSADLHRGTLFYSTLIGTVGKKRIQETRLYFLVLFFVLVFVLTVFKTNL